MISLAMWSGPRNISTALMRSFENRPDSVVLDEPFYAYYLKKTKINHPMKNKIINLGQTNKDRIISNITGPIPKNKKIWYQKHMAHHNIPNEDIKWIHKLTNCLLIRNPKNVILSYSKKHKLLSIDQLGYRQLFEIYKLLNSNGNNPIIIDSSDLLKDPKYYLKILCEKLKINFYPQMLSWPKGSRNSDGIWGKYWYNNVNNSTGFYPYFINDEEISNKYENIYLECLKIYNELYEIRFH